jgi:large subunit ribosomal protein L15
MKLKKRKKSSRNHGRGMGTAGTGARKNKRDSGNKGGKGMAGSGKRADHKKTLITKKYGHGYFGKKGITSIGTKRDKRDRINLQQIELNLGKYGKKTTKGFEIELKNYKILGQGEVKNKLIITAKEASASAVKKVKKAGGDILLSKKEEKEEIVKK